MATPTRFITSTTTPILSAKLPTLSTGMIGNTATISFTAQIPADEPISQYKLTQQI